jgi:hypothetical protein
MQAGAWQGVQTGWLHLLFGSHNVFCRTAGVLLPLLLLSAAQCCCCCQLAIWLPEWCK